MRKLIEFFENPVWESRMRFVFRVAVLLSMLIILFFAATGSAGAQVIINRTDEMVAMNEINASEALPVYNSILPVNRSNDQENGRMKVKLYPDPVSDYRLVLFPVLAAKTSVAVMTADGRLLLKQDLLKGATSAVLDVKNLPNGRHVLVFRQRKEKGLFKFTKS